jgi:hypothetical protein
MEEPDELDQLPTPTAPPPSWLDMNVETDLDVLLSKCFEDIQTTLATWAMVTGPHVSSSSSSSGDSEGSFQILPLLDSVTKMLDSIRNYTFNRQDLSTEAVNKLRMAALALLESMKELEGEHRLADEEGGSEGYIYSSSDFNLLERERQAILTYLDTIEKYGFNPPHHLGGSPATFTPEIKALMGKTSVLSIQDNQEEQVAKGSGVPVWLERGSFVNDPMARYHAMLMDNRDDTLTDPIPDPKEDEDAFLQSLW